MSCGFEKPAYTPTKCSDLPGMSYLMDDHLRRVNEIHNNVIREVLRMALKREPVLEDAKRLTMIRHPHDIMDYDLSFDGIMVGRVIFEFDGPKCSVTFKPDKKYSSEP